MIETDQYEENRLQRLKIRPADLLLLFIIIIFPFGFYSLNVYSNDVNIFLFPVQKGSFDLNSVEVTIPLNPIETKEPS